MSQVPPCDCPLAGYCDRHKMDKTEILHQVCQNDADQREAWDKQIKEGKSANGERMPSLIQRALSFARANIRFIRMGFEMRSEEEVERIYNICAQCPTGKWDASNKVCTDCGCKVQKARRLFFNKIAWKSEACPDGHWE